MTVRCTRCGGPMTEAAEDFDYSELSGLPVTLRAVKLRRCTKCTEHEVVIPRIEDLHRLMARAVIHKPGGLSGPEVRYLRKWMGLSGRDMAAILGVEPETVSRWEGGAKPIGPAAVRLLRTIASRTSIPDDYTVDEMRRIGERTDPVAYAARHVGDAWVPA